MESLVDQVMKLITAGADKNAAVVADEVIAAVRQYDFYKFPFNNSEGILSRAAVESKEGLEIVLPDSGKLQYYPKLTLKLQEAIFSDYLYWRNVDKDEPQPEVVKEQ